MPCMCFVCCVCAFVRRCLQVGEDEMTHDITLVLQSCSNVDSNITVCYVFAVKNFVSCWLRFIGWASMACLGWASLALLRWLGFASLAGLRFIG